CCDAVGRVAALPRWVSCRPGFFLPVRVLSRKFRGKFLALLRQAYEAGRLRWEPGVDAAAFRAWYRPLYAREWVVYAKAPFGGPEQVLKYLARYTHRVAISNARLLQLEGGQVTFRYKDYRQSHRQRVLTLSAVEFLRRWVQHVFPRGFVKIRHYGLWSNRQREAKLALCRWLLLAVTVLRGLVARVPSPEPSRRGPVCPWCGGEVLIRMGELPPPERAGCPGAAAPDTS